LKAASWEVVLLEASATLLAVLFPALLPMCKDQCSPTLAGLLPLEQELSGDWAALLAARLVHWQAVQT
jgi:hypothetical protein